MNEIALFWYAVSMALVYSILLAFIAYILKEWLDG